MDFEPEPADSPRNAAMAAALRRVQNRLLPSTATVYLLTAGGDALGAAMTMDTPLSFTITPGMAADDPLYTTAVAYHTGELVVMDPEDIRTLNQDDPATILYVPFPMRVAAVPLRTERHRLGAVTLRWAPARDIPAEGLEYLSAAADELAVELEKWAERGTSMLAPAIPVFISGAHGTAPLRPGTTESAGTPLDSARRGSGDALSGSSTFLYQLQRLSTQLTAAGRTRDVVAATLDQVVRPLGGNAVMLCLAEGGRLTVVGSAGFSKEDLRSVEGALLTRSTPETDATVNIKPMCFETVEDLHAAYPDLDRYDGGRARAFLPLIADGRAVGCCVLASDQPRTLRYEEMAVLMIMLGQVGQSLARARSYDLQYALTRSTQQGLLPRSLPHLAEIVTTARYLPATAGADVGGDWYDVIRLPGGGIGLVIGDVEGHNLEAVSVMGQLRSGVRAYATEGHDPASVLTRSNRLLVGFDTDLFATCCCMWLELDTGVACIASAGHQPPAITDVEGRMIDPRLTVGPPLGVDAGMAYGQSYSVLPPGAIAALFTDGLLNARRLGTDGGTDWLLDRLAEGRGEDLEVLADRLVGGRDPRAHRDDDIALLLTRYEGAPEGTPGRVARMSIQRHDLQQVRQLRHFLGDVMRGWRIEGIQDDLELLASEVVTNALIHAHSEVDVRLREYPDRIRVEVRDSDPHPPVPAAVLTMDEGSNQESESGRGLLIVEAVASLWGSSPAGRGKTTWFELAIPAAGR
ncbi:ATP-binding SpoIIE family protein phosphatase [Streptomyces sp. NPDC000880]